MASQTVELLRECGSGCKMAMNSMSQVLDFVEDPDQSDTIYLYEKKHKGLENRIRDALLEEGEKEYGPGLMASAMSWITTEAKMSMKADSRQAAKIMMDGCNMGIQSVSEYINKYPEASRESISIAKDLVRTEEAFMKDMQRFL